MTLMFGSTYVCGSVFSKMKLIKNYNRSRLTDSCLLRHLRAATTQLYVDIPPSVAAADLPPVSYTHLDVYKRQLHKCNG